MAKLRYVRDMNAAVASSPVLNSTVQTIRANYETDPEIAAALLPKPLQAFARPEIYIQSCHVAMHVSEDNSVEIGATTVAVMCEYKGQKGGYVLAMPMEGEFVCIGGREIFGEPKKIAAVSFAVEGNHFKTTTTRHDIPFIEMQGTIGESSGPAQFTEYFYCHKALPSITRNGGFDGDVLLTRLNWERNYSDVREAQGEIILRESPWDPLIDVPVRRIVSMQYAVGSSKTSGEILEKIPAEYIAPFIHQRYDDTNVPCIDVELSAELANA